MQRPSMWYFGGHRGRLAILLVATGLVLAGCDPERRQALRDLGHPTDAVRAAAVARLVKVDGPDAIPKIGKMLSDPSQRVRRAVVRALTQTRSARAVPYLMTALRDPHPEIRLLAVRGLGELKRKEAIGPLLARLSDPKPVIRRAARFALEDLGVDASRRRSLLARGELNRCLSLARTRTVQVRRSAAVNLGRSGLAEAVAPLIRLLQDPEPEVVEAAARALGRVGGRLPREALTAALKEKAPEVRKAAAAGLAVLVERAEDACRERWVADLFTWADPIVSGAAATRLAKCARHGRPRYVPGPEHLCPLLEQGPVEVVRAAAVLLPPTGPTCAGRSRVSPLVRVLVASVRGERPSAADLKALAVLLRHKPPPETLWRFVAGLDAPDVHRAVFESVRGLYDRYLRATEKWVTESQWKMLEADPEAAPLGPSSRPPSDPKSRKLARLLSRFSSRPEDEELELLPPSIRAGKVQAALRLVGMLPGNHKWLVQLSVGAPFPVRAAALNALAQRSYPEKPSREVVTAIRSALSGSGPLRRAAVRALGRMGRHGLAMLSEVLARDPDPSVRLAAAEALAQTGLKEARKPLREALKKRLDVSLIRAVAALKDPLAAPVLLMRLKQNPGGALLEERLALVEALGSVGKADSELVSALLEELEHPAPEVRAAAAKSLGTLMVGRARSALQACEKDFFWDVRQACRDALKRLEKHRESVAR